MGSPRVRLFGLWLLPLALVLAVGARGAISPPVKLPPRMETTGGGVSLRCRVPNPGKTTQDSEVVFGRFGSRARARAVVRRVRRSGFKRARIEREDCIFEVAIIFLSRHRAQQLVRKAHARHWPNARVMVS